MADQLTGRADRSWTAWLTEAVGDFTFGEWVRLGRITQAKADWLLAALAAVEQRATWRSCASSRPNSAD